MTIANLAARVVCIAAAAALITAVVIEHQSLARLQDENLQLRLQAEQLPLLQSENERLSNMVAVVGNSSSLSEKQMLELARLRSEVGKLREQGEAMTKLQDENRSIRAGYSAPLPVLKESLARANRDQCVSNLALIQAVKTQWALDNHQQSTDSPRLVDLLPYFRTLGGLPKCPDRGNYYFGSVEEKPRCNVPGHNLP